MHCNTREKASDFLKFLDKNGMKWCDGDSYNACNYWCVHEENTCYNFNEGMYADYKSCLRDNIKILEFDDFIYEEEKPCKFMKRNIYKNKNVYYDKDCDTK